MSRLPKRGRFQIIACFEGKGTIIIYICTDRTAFSHPFLSESIRLRTFPRGVISSGFSIASDITKEAWMSFLRSRSASSRNIDMILLLIFKIKRILNFEKFHQNQI